MKKKILSITVASAMALGAFGGAFAETHNGAELQTSNPYVEGYPDGSFTPEKEVTRAEATKMTAFMKPLEIGSESSFEDTDGHWAAGFITAVNYEGIVEGYPDGTFRPERKITRAEMAVIVSRLLEDDYIRERYSREGFESEPASLSDIEGNWAEEEIMNAVEAGIISGYPDGTFKPGEEVTRAEAVKLLNGVRGILEVNEAIEEKVENPFTDIDGHWAEEHILAASANYRYTVDDEGNLEVVDPEEIRSVASVEVSTNSATGETFLSAIANNFNEGAAASVRVTPGVSLGMEDIIIEDIEIGEDGTIEVSLGELPAGSYAAVVSVEDVSSRAVEFTIES